MLTDLPDSFQLVHLAEAARHAIASMDSTSAQRRPLTASVGVAFDDGDQRGPELFVAASEALRNAQTGGGDRVAVLAPRSEEHTSELQSLMRNSYAVFCLKKNNIN